MNEYRDLAFEAITTLGVLADLLGGDVAERIGQRVSTMAMKLAVYDSDEADEDDAATRAMLMGGLLYELQHSDDEPESAPPGESGRADREPSQCGVCPESLPAQYDELVEFPAPAPLPMVDVTRRRKAEPTDGMTVTRLPGVEVKPLPNEHPVNLTGTGRAGRPIQEFRMREVGERDWVKGTAGSLAKLFGVTSSQVYKWAGGKARSGKYEVVKVSNAEEA